MILIEEKNEVKKFWQSKIYFSYTSNILQLFIRYNAS